MFELDIEKPPQLNEVIYNQLRKAIVSGRIPPGITLIQEQLADQFGVSRTPIRDALDRLIKDGFAKRKNGGRVVVADLSLQELREKYEVRQALEVLAIRLATEHISQDQLDKLRAILEQPRKGDEHQQSLNRGIDFHDMIIKASGNNFLIQILRGINDSIRRYRSLGIDIPGQVERSKSEHRAIYEAIAEGDEEAAVMLLQQHMDDLKSKLEKSLA